MGIEGVPPIEPVNPVHNNRDPEQEKKKDEKKEDESVQSESIEEKIKRLNQEEGKLYG